MTDTEFELRTGSSGIPVEGTPGNVLTITSDGLRVQPQPLPSGGGLPIGGVVRRAGNTFFPGSDDADTLVALSGDPLSYSGSSQFTLIGEDAAATLRYEGVDPIDVIVTVNCVFSSSTTGHWNPEVAIALNGDVLGSGGDRLAAGLGVTSVSGSDNANVGSGVTIARQCTMSNGDEVQAAIGELSAGAAYPMGGFTLTIAQIDAT